MITSISKDGRDGQYIIRVAIAGFLSLSMFQTAIAAEILFVGTYYVRSSKDACGEGGYIKRDAAKVAALESIRREFWGNQQLIKDGTPGTYKRGEVVAIYSYMAKDVNYMGVKKCTYRRYNSLSAKTTLEAENKLKERAIKYKDSFLSEPSIVFFWHGDNVEKAK